ncbi:MAG: S-layer homology domain-containing protein [Veillonellales bacterium]
MKKTLILTLALVFVLSIGSAAFAAANPFVDVPAKHWSYDAVAKLAQAGLIDGYNDGTFRGDKTMTRYEMAQVVAKAMAKSDKASAENKALVDKLAVEFSSELQNLGVRVAKLEANQSAVKIGGDIRMRYDNLDKSDAVWKNRLRITMTGNINDTTSLYARYVAADNNFGHIATTTDNPGAEGTNRLSDLALTTKGLIHNTDVTVGRYTLQLGPTQYLAGTTGNIDGIQTKSKFDKFGLMLGYADASYWQHKDAAYYARVNGVRATTPSSEWQDMKDIYYAEATYAFDKKIKMNVDYFKNQDNGAIVKNYNIFGGGVTYQFAPKWNVIGEYYRNTADGAKDGFDGNSPKATIGRLTYGQANLAKPGSFALFGEYAKFEGHVFPYAMMGPYTKTDGDAVGVKTGNGIKFWDFQVAYVLAKNINFEGVYQFNIKDAKTGDDAPNKNFTRLQINYFF